MFSVQPDVVIDVVAEPFADDFLNCIEVACSIRSPEEDGSNMAIGVTFLNKHCFVTDLKPLKDEGPTLIKRSIELKLEVLQQILGWNLLIIDEAEYMELFNKGKEAKEEREAYIMERLNIGQ